HFIIQYIFPEQSNSRALGLDIASESTRKKAALNSAINNQVQLSAPITLIQADNKSKQGFLILLPVYKNIIIPTDKIQRLEQLIGWTYSPLLIN
ncbi:CHASE domain-containing protein, partial [Pseudoalteromonas sp. 24-MNA-CIBAN-0067]